jgi:hypothetical protein
MTMDRKTYPPSRLRSDVGVVVFPIEKMFRARELSSSCVGVEAMLETDGGTEGFLTRATVRGLTRKKIVD